MYLHPRRPIKPKTSASIKKLEATQQLMRSRQKLQFAPYHVQLQPHRSRRLLLPSLFTPVFVIFPFFSGAAGGGKKRPDGSVELGKKKIPFTIFEWFSPINETWKSGALGQMVVPTTQLSRTQ